MTRIRPVWTVATCGVALLVTACHERSDPRQLSLAQCHERGGAPIGIPDLPFMLGSPGEDLGRDDDCPSERTLLGVIEQKGDANGGLCCELPARLSVAMCQAMGGHILGDPGSGQSYVEGCEQGAKLLGWLNDGCDSDLCGEGGICCAD